MISSEGWWCLAGHHRDVLACFYVWFQVDLGAPGALGAYFWTPLICTPHLGGLLDLANWSDVPGIWLHEDLLGFHPLGWRTQPPAQSTTGHSFCREKTYLWCRNRCRRFWKIFKIFGRFFRKILHSPMIEENDWLFVWFLFSLYADEFLDC